MDTRTLPLSRRSFLAASAAVSMSALLHTRSVKALSTAIPLGNEAIHPFQIAIPQSALDYLHDRLSHTRWPDKETVPGDTQGVQLARIQALVDYWRDQYDWRATERRLNKLPQFITEIDGTEIHYIHVRSRHKNALPLIMTHGWPGSIIEFLKVIDPLTNPTAHGGRAEDAFHLILPSLPGYGFSGKPTAPGWDRYRVAHAWDTLMKRLGYSRYVAQGGDWGAIVVQVMGQQAPKGLAGIHVNMPAVIPKQLPAKLTGEEQAAVDAVNKFLTKEGGYALVQGSKPQTIAYAMADSPVGQAAWIYEKFQLWTDSNGEPEKVLTREEMLDDIMFYYITDSAASSNRFYWENASLQPFAAVDISIPVGVTVFPREHYQAPRAWAEQTYHKLIYFNKAEKGGHFAAFEQPGIFTREVRAAFRSLR